jgi:two-component system, NtrC family, response regulator AtoC
LRVEDQAECADWGTMPMRTLILDDERAMVELLGRVSSAAGHTVKAFTSSAEALAYLAIEPVDLLITDMCMPGADGPMVIHAARRLQPELFTMMITGHAGQYPLAQILATGTADVIFKPFHLNELRARLALCERRWRLVGQLMQLRRDQQTSSNEMIEGLRLELEALRSRRSA